MVGPAPVSLAEPTEQKKTGKIGRRTNGQVEHRVRVDCVHEVERPFHRETHEPTRCHHFPSSGLEVARPLSCLGFFLPECQAEDIEQSTAPKPFAAKRGRRKPGKSFEAMPSSTKPCHGGRRALFSNSPNLLSLRTFSRRGKRRNHPMNISRLS